jgi:hypothetical protein
VASYQLYIVKFTFALSSGYVDGHVPPSPWLDYAIEEKRHEK